MSNLPYKQVSNVERRTWDKAAYEARAKARAAAADATITGLPTDQNLPVAKKDGGENVIEEEEVEKEEFVSAASGAAGPAKSQRAYLKARRGRVDLESKVGTSEIINPDAVAVSGLGPPDKTSEVKITDGVTKSSTGVGWHCKVCDCYLKDSLTYLDHINGRKHQRYLGFSMRVEQVSAKEVTGKLSELAKGRQATSDNGSGKGIILGKGRSEEEADEFEEIVRKKDEEALRRKAERARKREERKRREQEEAEEEQDGVDPDLAAMMGFGGFGGSNKNR